MCENERKDDAIAIVTTFEQRIILLWKLVSGIGLCKYKHSIF
jgi:hypothetical protein